MTTPLHERFARLPAPALEDALELVPGRPADYEALAEHHYKARRPATATRVLVLRHRRRRAAERFGEPWAQQTLCGDVGAPAAVLVESLPSLGCRLRDLALAGRFALRDAGQRARLLNAQVRCISRVVVHPQWRGLGLAVRLVRAALERPTTLYTEALAAMGQVSPFFERAGMTAYHRPMHESDARLRAALEYVGLDMHELAFIERALARLGALPADRRRLTLRELRRWHRPRCGRSRRCESDPLEQLRAARQRLLCRPVYYLHDNRAHIRW